MGDDRIDFDKTVTFLKSEEKKSDNPFFEEEEGLDYKYIKDHGINLIGVEWYLGRVNSIKLKM